MYLRKTAIVLALCLVSAGVVVAADALSGKWSGEWGPNLTERNPLSADLKYDGKAISGTFNPGANQAKISKGTYNEKTGAVHIEADAMGRGGSPVHYVIEGKLDKGKLSGTWKYENGSGDFVIKKE